MTRFLEVSGELEVMHGERRIAIVGEGAALRVEIGALAPRPPTLRSVRIAAGIARTLSRYLTAHGLTLTVTRSGVSVARFGKAARGGPLGWMLGLYRLRPRSSRR